MLPCFSPLVFLHHPHLCVLATLNSSTDGKQKLQYFWCQGCCLKSRLEYAICCFEEKRKKHFCGVLNPPLSMWIWEQVKMTSDTDTGLFGHMSNFLSKKVVSSSGYFGLLVFQNDFQFLNHPLCLVNAGVCVDFVSEWRRLQNDLAIKNKCALNFPLVHLVVHLCDHFLGNCTETRLYEVNVDAEAPSASWTGGPFSDTGLLMDLCAVL